MKLSREFVVGLLVFVVGLASLACAVQLWIIDTQTHYVTITPVEAYMQYSLDNSTWVNSTVATAGSQWYARLVLNYKGANVQARVIWDLYSPSGWVLNPVGFETTVTLTESLMEIYVSLTGTQTDNYNWGIHTASVVQAFDYRVRATVNRI